VDPFAQGHGLLNVEKAFEHLTEHRQSKDNMLRWVLVRGIYWQSLSNQIWE